MTELTTDIEFKTLIYPVSDEEYSALDKDIFFNGCRHKIGIWEGRSFRVLLFTAIFFSVGFIRSWIYSGFPSI